MNGRVAKRMRREGLRKVKIVPKLQLSEKDITDLTFDKKLYRERRNIGLNGMPRPAIVVQQEFAGDMVIGLIGVSGKRPPKSVTQYGYYSDKEAARINSARQYAFKNPLAPSAKVAPRSNGRGS